MHPESGARTRADELAYLERLLADIEVRARQYSALGAEARLDAGADDDPRRDPTLEAVDIALLCLERRHEWTSHPFNDILEAFEQVRAVALLGAPGAGKSTTLRRLAVNLARAALDDPTAPVPLLVALGQWSGDELLRAFIAAHLPEVGHRLDALAAAGRLVLLLDGLNEVPSASRETSAAAVQGLVNALSPPPPRSAVAARSPGPITTPAAPPRVRVIVSCRLDDYTGALDLGLDTLTLLPLTPERVRAVLHQWTDDRREAPERAEALFWQLAGDPRLADVLATWRAAGISEAEFWTVRDPYKAHGEYARPDYEQVRLWKACVWNRRGLLRLAANPFMLFMLYHVWRRDGALPTNRGALFARFIDRLLAREGLIRQDPGTGAWTRDPRADRLLAGLAALAWRMQATQTVPAADAAGRDFGVLTVLQRAEAVTLIGDASLCKVAEDATLLEGGDAVRFRHQLFQEYFTAIALRQRLDQDRCSLDALWPADCWWTRTGWEEAAMLLVGLSGDDGWPVIRWLKDAQPEVAAQCLLDSGAWPLDARGRPVLTDAQRTELRAAWLPRLTDPLHEPNWKGRAVLGRALAMLDLDNRPGLGLIQAGPRAGLPDIAWMAIPAGEFLYGERKERSHCEAFRIARYPVTDAQFQVFLDAPDGYADDRWWEGLTKPDRQTQPARWPIATHPREMVSWHEAMAFCAWLSARLTPDSGWVIRLPTEWEWERAARWTDGRLNAWGDDYRPGRDNIVEAREDACQHNLGQTSAAGLNPLGAVRLNRPEPDDRNAPGICDLCGNLWEWCLNEGDELKHAPPGDTLSRVVRGGAWSSQPADARAAYRNHIAARDRYGGLGFRLVCAAPIRGPLIR